MLGTRNMEGSVAVRLDALNTSPLSSPTDVTGQLPPRCRDLINRVYRFQEDSVTEVDLRDPQRTQDVDPAVTLGLFEGPGFGGAEHAVHGLGGAVQTPSTEPLSLRDEGDAVAILVDCQVTHVTE